MQNVFDGFKIAIECTLNISLLATQQKVPKTGRHLHDQIGTCIMERLAHIQIRYGVSLKVGTGCTPHEPKSKCTLNEFEVSAQ